MAKKKVTAVIKLQCPAQKATPAPPVGPALGPHGVSAPQFVQQFNDKTKGFEAGLIIPVIITVYFYSEDSTSSSSHQEGSRHPDSIRHTKQGQGWKAYRCTAY